MTDSVSTPSVAWAQRSNCIFLSVELADVKNPKIDIQPKSVSFDALGGPDSREYKVTVDLFDEVSPEKSAHSVGGRVTEFCLKKKEEKFWPRLTESTTKKHWLKIDFNKWVDEDDSDDEKKGMGGMDGMPGMGGMGGMPGMGGMGGGDYDFEEMMKSMGGLGGAGAGMGMGMGGKPDLGNLDDGSDSDDDGDANLPDLE